MESDPDLQKSGENIPEQNPLDSFVTQFPHLSLDPVINDSFPVVQAEAINTAAANANISPSEGQLAQRNPSGRRHSILTSGNRAVFKRPNLSELKERYKKTKESLQQLNEEVDSANAKTSVNQKRGRKSFVTLSDIVTAAFWIREGVPKTPCERAACIPEIENMEVYFKREYTNPSGSFKDRGARNALLRLTKEQQQLGIVTSSPGNHAIALAFHGLSLGIPVTVLFSENTTSTPVKIKKCEKYGGDIFFIGCDETELKENAVIMQHEQGLTYIDENTYPDVISGQGTMGLEIVDQLEGVDAIIVPVGGGDLLAGTCVAVKTMYPSIKIIAVESDLCPKFKAAIVEGKPQIMTPIEETIAEELCFSNISNKTFRITQGLVDKCITVKEEHIALAVLRLLEYEKVAVEGSGAAGLAALIGGYLPELKGKSVVVVLREGNMDPALLGRVITRGLTADGRLVRFQVRIDDSPGSMATLLKLITSTGANITNATQESGWDESNTSGFQAKVIAEVSDSEHSCRLKSVLEQNFLVTYWSSESQKRE